MKKGIYKTEIEDWDRNASFYEIESISPYKKILNKKIISLCDIKKKKLKILDIGAGMGEFAYWVNMHTDNTVICVDFSKEMQKVSKSHYSDIEYKVCSAHKLPFKDSTFDMVIALGVFHHLKVQGILEESHIEIFRVLKKDGQLCYLDRSFTRNAGIFEKILFRFKKGYQKGRKFYPASSTSNEISLSKKDVGLIRDGYKVMKRRSIYSIPFKLLLVVSHTFKYVAGQRTYMFFQNMTYPFAWIFERVFSCRFLETEYVELLQKRKNV